MLQGESGIVRAVHDFDDADADPTYTISVQEGALTPLYFRFHLEDGRPFGIAILQTLGKEGMKGTMEAFLKAHVVAADGQRPTVRLVQLLDARVLEQFAASGKLQDIILLNRGSSTASRDAMRANTVGQDSLGDDGDKLELRLRKKDGWPRRAIRSLVRAAIQHDNPRGLVHSPIGAIDDLMVEIELDGRRQRFSMLNPDDSPIRYDKTGQLQPGPTGLPSFAALDAAASEVWDDVQDLL
jgi:hypothetical protein